MERCVTINQNGQSVLLGSVPLSSAEEVFEAMSSVLGKFVRRILDSETGPRSLWIVCQSKTMKSVQLLSPIGYSPRTSVRIRIAAAIRSSTFFSSLFAMSMRRSVVSTSRMYSRLETIRLSSSRSAGALPWGSGE